MAPITALRRETFEAPRFRSAIEADRSVETSPGSRLLAALAPGLQASFDTALEAPLTGRLAELLGRLDAAAQPGTR